MKFALNDEQLALSDATKDFFRTRSTSDVVRAAIVSPTGYDKALFADMCTDLGLASLVIPESFGGLGAGDVELAVVMEQHGYYLAPTPLRVHVSAAMAVDECVSDAYKQEHLSRLASGEELSCTNFSTESGSNIKVQRNENAAIVNGTFTRVPFGNDIRHFYFVAEVDGTKSLLYLDCTGPSITKKMIASIDQTQPLGEIICSAAPATVVSEKGVDVTQPFERARSRAIIAACNEMVGSTQAVLDMSVAYAKDRVQFGRPIGSFQAIKHKCADMLLETESSRSISLYGAWLASQPKGFISDELEDDLNHIAAMAKYYVSHALSHGAGENIQIHGGIGFTMEHDAQLYFKRAAFMNAHLGLPTSHATKIAHDLRVRIS